MSLRGKIIYYVLTGARKSKEAHEHIKELSDMGAKVYVILTPNALNLVDINKLEEASGNYIRSSFNKKNGESLPLEEIIIIAPATYSTINKITNGIADNFATSCIAAAIGRKTPIYLAPSMNIDLWSSPIIQGNLNRLQQLGVKIIHPRIEGNYCTMAFASKVNDAVIYDYEKIRFQSKEENLMQYQKEYKKLLSTHYIKMKNAGERIVSSGLSNGSKGCISMKVSRGFLISSSGAEIGNLKESDITWVLGRDDNTIKWVGSTYPSSETPMHFKMYEHLPDVNAVIHGHCPQITYGVDYEQYRTKEYLRYGTFEFGEELIKHMKEYNDRNFVIARDHGEVAIGTSLDNAIDNVIKICNYERLEIISQ